MFHFHATALSKYAMELIEIAFSQERYNLLTKIGSIDSYSKARKDFGARHEKAVSVSTDACKFQAEMLADRVAVFFFCCRSIHGGGQLFVKHLHAGAGGKGERYRDDLYWLNEGGPEAK
jgi:hypothetical protein